MNKAAVGITVIQRAVHESTKASAQLERRVVSVDFRRSVQVKKFLKSLQRVS